MIFNDLIIKINKYVPISQNNNSIIASFKFSKYTCPFQSPWLCQNTKKSKTCEN